MTFVFALALCSCASFAEAELHPNALKETLDELSPPSVESGLRIPFKEARSFPFRRYPKNFEGAAYMTLGSKLAIIYSFPSSYRILIEGEEMELIYDDGETRNLSDEAGLRLFTDLLKWDTEAILQSWSATSIDQQDERYQMSLVPLDPILAKSIKELSIHFDAQRVFSVNIKQKDGVGRKYEFGSAVPVNLDDPEIKKVFSR